MKRPRQQEWLAPHLAGLYDRQRERAAERARRQLRARQRLPLRARVVLVAPRPWAAGLTLEPLDVQRARGRV